MKKLRAKLWLAALDAVTFLGLPRLWVLERAAAADTATWPEEAKP